MSELATYEKVVKQKLVGAYMITLGLLVLGFAIDLLGIAGAASDAIGGALIALAVLPSVMVSAKMYEQIKAMAQRL